MRPNGDARSVRPAPHHCPAAIFWRVGGRELHILQTICLDLGAPRALRLQHLFGGINGIALEVAHCVTI